ncbi:MAG: hypothetical protein MHM6MM_000438 [Cercozoa sp. M6MM]
MPAAFTLSNTDPEDARCDVAYGMYRACHSSFGTAKYIWASGTTTDCPWGVLEFTDCLRSRAGGSGVIRLFGKEKIANNDWEPMCRLARMHRRRNRMKAAMRPPGLSVWRPRDRPPAQFRYDDNNNNNSDRENQPRPAELGKTAMTPRQLQWARSQPMHFFMQQWRLTLDTLLQREYRDPLHDWSYLLDKYRSKGSFFMRNPMIDDAFRAADDKVTARMRTWAATAPADGESSDLTQATQYERAFWRRFGRLPPPFSTTDQVYDKSNNVPSVVADPRMHLQMCPPLPSDELLQVDPHVRLRDASFQPEHYLLTALPSSFYNDPTPLKDPITRIQYARLQRELWQSFEQQISQGHVFLERSLVSAKDETATDSDSDNSSNDTTSDNAVGNSEILHRLNSTVRGAVSKYVPPEVSEQVHTWRDRLHDWHSQRQQRMTQQMQRDAGDDASDST